MSVTFNPGTLLYAVVKYLKSSEHIYDPVDTEPERDGQYRLVCLAVNSDEVWRVAYVLRALSDGIGTVFAWLNRSPCLMAVCRLLSAIVRPSNLNR